MIHETEHNDGSIGDGTFTARVSDAPGLDRFTVEIEGAFVSESVTFSINYGELAEPPRGVPAHALVRDGGSTLTPDGISTIPEDATDRTVLRAAFMLLRETVLEPNESIDPDGFGQYRLGGYDEAGRATDVSLEDL